MKRVLLFIPFFYLLILILSSCRDVIPLWKGHIELENFVLAQDSSACQIEMRIDSIAPIMYVEMELEVKYDTYTGRSFLPLQLGLADTSGLIRPFSQIQIPIRKKGKWLGHPYKKDKEYIITHTALPRLKIHPGIYTLYIFADNTDLPFLPGIVEIGVRIYQI